MVDMYMKHDQEICPQDAQPLKTVTKQGPSKPARRHDFSVKHFKISWKQENHDKFLPNR